MMFLVGCMLLAHCLFPSFVFGKEGIGIGWSVVYLSKAEAVGMAECLLVDTRSTYYIYILVLRAVGKCLVE